MSFIERYLLELLVDLRSTLIYVVKEFIKSQDSAIEFWDHLLIPVSRKDLLLKASLSYLPK